MRDIIFADNDSHKDFDIITDIESLAEAVAAEVERKKNGYAY